MWNLSPSSIVHYACIHDIVYRYGQNVLFVHVVIGRSMFINCLAWIVVYLNDPKIAIINAWTPKSNKVIVLGFFASCVNMGNILGFAYSGLTIEVGNLSMLTPVYMSGSTLLATTIIFHLFACSKPKIVSEMQLDDNSHDP